MNGGDDIPIEKESAVELNGCKVEQKMGRYFCVANTDDAIKIGTNTLSGGVSYFLNDGMIITTADGDEYEVKLEGGATTSGSRDPMMGMLFDSMKAQFGVNDNDDSK